MFCSKCGKEIDDAAVVCPNCGCATQNYRSHQIPEDSSAKSRLMALLLAIFLGGFGVHRFYLGKIGTGILWLLTGGCFGVGWLIDCIIIACGQATDRDGYRVTEWEV